MCRTDLRRSPLLQHLCVQFLHYVHSPFWSTWAYFGQNVLWFLCKDLSAPPGEHFCPKLTLEPPPPAKKKKKKQHQAKNAPKNVIQILPKGTVVPEGHFFIFLDQNWNFMGHSLESITSDQPLPRNLLKTDFPLEMQNVKNKKRLKTPFSLVDTPCWSWNCCAAWIRSLLKDL